MTQTPAAGWYPDPDPASTDQPGRLRYWDGAAWTEQVQAPAPQPMPYPETFGQPQAGYYSPALGYPQVGYYDVPNRETTPDGVPLAGWWWRVLALLLDGVILIPFYAIAAVPLLAARWDDISQWSDDMQYAADNNLSDPPLPWVFYVLIVATFCVSLLYQFLFLLWKQATPGKLITGLRVRLRDRPELPAGAIGLRLLAGFLVGLCSIAALLDYLWPLWDDKRQALHDKMAKTNVVRVR
jgi:uncharacterized RDD family membrane protein YckC